MLCLCVLHRVQRENKNESKFEGVYVLQGLEPLDAQRIEDVEMLDGGSLATRARRHGQRAQRAYVPAWPNNTLADVLCAPKR